MKQTFSQLFCQTVFCPVPPDCLNYENMVIKHEEITPVLVCFFSLFYTKYSKKTNQSFHNKNSSVHYKTTQWRRSRNVVFRNEPLLCRSPEGHPGSAGRRKLNERRAELTGSSGLLFCALTMSWVVPIFLASSLRSIVLRYRYLLRSSPSRMFFTGFWRLRLSLCSILDTIDKHVTHISILNCNVS